MIFSDELIEKKLYKQKLSLPITDDKYKGSVVFMAAPNPDITLDCLASNILNFKYYHSYFIEKNIMYYINQEGAMVNEETMILESANSTAIYNFYFRDLSHEYPINMTNEEITNLQNYIVSYANNYWKSASSNMTGVQKVKLYEFKSPYTIDNTDGTFEHEYLDPNSSNYILPINGLATDSKFHTISFVNGSNNYTTLIRSSYGTLQDVWLVTNNGKHLEKLNSFCRESVSSIINKTPITEDFKVKITKDFGINDVKRFCKKNKNNTKALCWLFGALIVCPFITIAVLPILLLAVASAILLSLSTAIIISPIIILSVCRKLIDIIDDKIFYYRKSKTENLEEANYYNTAIEKLEDVKDKIKADFDKLISKTNKNTNIVEGHNIYYDYNPEAFDESNITGLEDDIEILPNDTETVVQYKNYLNDKIHEARVAFAKETNQTILEVSIRPKFQKGYVIKNYEDLNQYTQIPITPETISKYTPSCNSLMHLRGGSDFAGDIFLDGADVVGYINVDLYNNTLQTIEITENYRGHGLGGQLFKHAMHKFKVDNLVVHKDNLIAKRMYEKNGFKVYKNIGPVLFMKTATAKVESFISTTTEEYVSDIDYISFSEDNKTLVFGFEDDNVIFTNEANGYNNRLRKFLYKDRFKTPKPVLDRYRYVKKQFPRLNKEYLDIAKYKGDNLIVDLGYYLSSFENNIENIIPGGDKLKLMKVYFDYLNRLINDSRFDELYTMKSVFVPLDAWRLLGSMFNPLSLILSMLKKNATKELLQKWNMDFIFFTSFGYFKLNPSKLDIKDISKINLLVDRLYDKNIEDDSNKDSKKTIVASITDDLEKSQNIKIHSLTGDPENASKDELIKAINKAADTANNKDAAIKTLDNNDEEANRIKELIAKLAEDEDEVKISAARRARLDDAQSQTLKKTIRNTTIADMIKSSEENEPLPVTKLEIDTVNEEWENLTFTNFENVYNVDDDIIRILNCFADKKNAVVLRDVTIEDTSTSEDFIETYTASFEDAQGQRFKILFDIPKFTNHKFMYLRGNEKTFNSQLMLIPLSKSDDDTVQVVSNYKKIFLRRYNTVAGKSYQTTDRLMKALSKYDGKDIKATFGDNSKICRRYDLPIDYIDMASVYNTITTPQYTFYFNLDNFYKKHGDKIDPKKGIPLCIDKDNHITYFSYFDDENTTCSDLIASILCMCKDFNDLFNTIKPANKYTYSQASILNRKIPLIVILAYNEGLIPILEKANIKYEIREKRGKITTDEGFIKFNDAFIVYKNSYSASLLLNGIKECNTEDYSIENVNNKAMYIDFLELFGGRILADGLDNFYELMIDPMTYDVLKRYKLPTTYTELLIEANSILADNNYTKHIDLSSNRFRSNEILAGYTYQCLAESYGNYSSALKKMKKLPMTMKRTAIIDAIMADPTCGDNSALNDLGIVESINTVSFKGLAGMNSDRSYSLDKRTFDKSMINLLGMSTGFAGNVGLNRQCTIDMNIDGKRGYLKIDPNPNKMSITKSFAITEAVTPFGSTRDDPFRTAMTFIQTSKHGMRVKKGMPSLISTGADQALPYLSSNIFSVVVKKPGKVVEKTDDFMIIQYKDGTSEYINLAPSIQKNSNGGFYISIKLETKLKVGSTVKPNDIVAYDPLSYSDAIGDTGDIAYNLGPLVKIVAMNTDEGYEDSTIIAEYLSKDMASDVVHVQNCTLAKDSNVYYMVQKGQKIKEGESLIIFQNAFDDKDVNILLKNLSDDEDEISDLGRRPKKSHIEGVVEDIKIYRTCEKEEMSESLRKIVNKYEKPISDRKKILAKYNVEDINYKLPADYKLEQTGKLKNVNDGLIIEFYLKYEDEMAIGDKLVYYSALKGVVKDIFPLGDEPRSEYRPDEIIGSLLSIGSVNARMVTSVLVLGGINKGLIELDRHIKDMCGIKWKYLYED